MIRYVDLYPMRFEEKYQYVKTMRAQLSTHEQALLLLNSLTPLGYVWWNKNLITNYRLVQNIPRNFFDSTKEIDPTNMFSADYFEWQEDKPIPQILQNLKKAQAD